MALSAAEYISKQKHTKKKGLWGQRVSIEGEVPDLDLIPGTTRPSRNVEAQNKSSPQLNVAPSQIIAGSLMQSNTQIT